MNEVQECKITKAEAENNLIEIEKKLIERFHFNLVCQAGFIICDNDISRRAVLIGMDKRGMIPEDALVAEWYEAREIWNDGKGWE